MSVLPAGSTLWLLGHELRLTLRGRSRGRGGRRRLTPGLILGLVAVCLCVPGWMAAKALKSVQIAVSPELAMAVNAGMALIFTLMTSATVLATAIAFYDRGELDLLLSSPVPSRRVLTVRCIGIALQSALLWVLLITPFAGPGLVQGDLRWLGVYPLLLGLGLLAAALGLSVAMALFRLIGARRTRSAATVVSALIGVSFGLAGQAPNLIGRNVYGQIWAQMQAWGKNGLFDAGQPLAWPAEGLFGNLAIAFGLFAGALALFWLVTQSIGRRFAADAAAAAGASGKTRVTKGGLKAFGRGAFGVTIGKELKLIFRDGALLSQTLIQVLYLGVIFAALLFKNLSRASVFVPAGGAGLLVFLAGNLAAVFGWIVMSAEDAPELLAAAPTPAKVLRRAKLVAAMIPVAGVTALPITGLLIMNLQAGLAALAASAGVAWSAGLISIWYEKPAKRTELRRRRNGSFLGSVIGGVVGICWSGAAFFAALPPPWTLAALAPLILAGVILGVAAKPDRSFAEGLVGAFA